jgi:poly(3-hydroxyalkanoate) synthetase
MYTAIRRYYLLPEAIGGGVSSLPSAGTQDDICRMPQAEAVMSLVGSQDKVFCVLDGGHIGMMTGAEAKQGLWLKVHRWLEPHLSHPPIVHCS